MGSEPQQEADTEEMATEDEVAGVDAYRGRLTLESAAWLVIERTPFTESYTMPI